MTDDITGTPAEQPAPADPGPAAGPADPGPAAAPAPADPEAGPAAREAWDAVVASMADLGDAVARWARAAANDPAARQKLGQIRGGINDIAAKAETAFSQVTESDVGKQFAQGAEQAGQAIGDAAQQFSTAAAPHVKSAFAGLASAFSRAADKVDEAARSHEANTTVPAAAPPAPAPAPAPAAPAPAASPAAPAPAPPIPDSPSTPDE